MATYYVGPRPVIKGRDTVNMVNPYKGTAGTYSYYPLFATSHALDGAPDNNHVPGTGYHPSSLLLSQLFTGSTLYEATTPLAGTFADGVAYDGARFRPHEYKGLSGTKALDGGHAKRNLYYGAYSNYIFDGVTSAEAFAGMGHAKRSLYYGLYNNYIFDGVTSAEVMPDGYGQGNERGDYGRAKVNEWAGVPSAQAL
jgi:hypothetical protein